MEHPSQDTIPKAQRDNKSSQNPQHGVNKSHLLRSILSPLSHACWWACWRLLTKCSWLQVDIQDTRVCAHRHMHTHTHTQSYLGDACCQFLAWQTRNILVVCKYVPIHLGTLLRFKHICVRCSQDYESPSIHTHTPPQQTCMYSGLLSTKDTTELDSFTGCTVMSWIVLFFSNVIEMLFFPLIYHYLSPLPNQPVRKDVYFAFSWHNFISDKCISDADSIFLGHTFEILVD